MLAWVIILFVLGVASKNVSLPSILSGPFEGVSQPVWTPVRPDWPAEVGATVASCPGDESLPARVFFYTDNNAVLVLNSSPGGNWTLASTLTKPPGLVLRSFGLGIAVSSSCRSLAITGDRPWPGLLYDYNNTLANYQQVLVVQESISQLNSPQGHNIPVMSAAGDVVLFSHGPIVLVRSTELIGIQWLGAALETPPIVPVEAGDSVVKAGFASLSADGSTVLFSVKSIQPNKFSPALIAWRRTGPRKYCVTFAERVEPVRSFEFNNFGTTLALNGDGSLAVIPDKCNDIVYIYSIDHSAQRASDRLQILYYGGDFGQRGVATTEGLCSDWGLGLSIFITPDGSAVFVGAPGFPFVKGNTSSSLVLPPPATRDVGPPGAIFALFRESMDATVWTWQLLAAPYTHSWFTAGITFAVSVNMPHPTPPASTAAGPLTITVFIPHRPISFIGEISTSPGPNLLVHILSSELAMAPRLPAPPALPVCLASIAGMLHSGPTSDFAVASSGPFTMPPQAVSSHLDNKIEFADFSNDDKGISMTECVTDDGEKRVIFGGLRQFSVYAQRNSTGGNWALIQQLVKTVDLTHVDFNDGFGQSVTVSRSCKTLVVGCQAAIPVYVYQLNESTQLYERTFVVLIKENVTGQVGVLEELQLTRASTQPFALSNEGDFFVVAHYLFCFWREDEAGPAEGTGKWQNGTCKAPVGAAVAPVLARTGTADWTAEEYFAVSLSGDASTILFTYIPDADRRNGAMPIVSVLRRRSAAKFCMVYSQPWTRSPLTDAESDRLYPLDFGWSHALTHDGELAVIGNPMSGEAYVCTVFDSSGIAGLTVLYRLVPPYCTESCTADGSENDWGFGYSVRILPGGEAVFVGSPAFMPPNATLNGPLSGGVFIFFRGNNPWTSDTLPRSWQLVSSATDSPDNQWTQGGLSFVVYVSDQRSSAIDDDEELDVASVVLLIPHNPSYRDENFESRFADINRPVAYISVAHFSNIATSFPRPVSGGMLMKCTLLETPLPAHSSSSFLNTTSSAFQSSAPSSMRLHHPVSTARIRPISTVRVLSPRQQPLPSATLLIIGLFCAAALTIAGVVASLLYVRWRRRRLSISTQSAYKKGTYRRARGTSSFGSMRRSSHSRRVRSGTDMILFNDSSSASSHRGSRRGSQFVPQPLRGEHQQYSIYSGPMKGKEVNEKNQYTPGPFIPLGVDAEQYIRPPPPISGDVDVAPSAQYGQLELTWVCPCPCNNINMSTAKFCMRCDRDRLSL